MPNSLHAIYGVEQGLTVELITHYVSLYERLVVDKGEVFAIDFLKKVHGVCLRFASNSTFDLIPYVDNDSDGIPVMVSSFKSLLMSDVNKRRCALCILSLFKMVLVRGESPSLDSIVNEYEPPLNLNFKRRGEFLSEASSKLVAPLVTPSAIEAKFRCVLEEMFPRRFWKRRLGQISRSSRLHVTSRNGPNGQAISAALIDLYALHTDVKLFKAICSLAVLTNHKDLLEFLNDDPENAGLIESLLGKEPLHSRLSIKIEPGAKTRFFAICDYFTQSVLKGFHDWIFKYLSHIPGDGTLSQDSVCKIVKQWTAEAEAKSVGIYSTDLSKATDRLPAYLQREIVWQIAGKDFAELWFTIISQRDFSVPNSDSTVRYSVGQPMGAYSSWAMLAVTHHVICRLALKLIGREFDVSNPAFVIVGDDNALVGSDLEQMYKYLLVDLCHVPISPLKGFSPETTSGANPLPYSSHSVAEFCKRVFYNGQEISTVSPMTLKAAMEYPVDFPMLISDCNKRETWPSLDDVGMLAWMGYNPDQALVIASFPLTSALPSNILEGLESLKEPLGIHWFDEDVKPLLRPMYLGKLLETVGESVSDFAQKISLFKESFGHDREIASYRIRAQVFYRRLLGLVSDQLSYSVVKLAGKIRPSDVEDSLVKRIVCGLLNLDDFKTVLYSKNKSQPIDQPKRVSGRLSKLVWEVSKHLKGDFSSALAMYSYYDPQFIHKSEETPSDKSDVVFIDFEDDWEMVVPIHMQNGQEIESDSD